jgi:molybdenum cofactor cytidylyltransferase
VTGIVLVLAAGAGRRFGGPKQLAHVGGQTLLARAVGAVRRSGATPIVVLGAHRSEVQAGLDADVVCAFAPDWSLGMGASIRAGMEVARPLEPTTVTLLACDQPGVTAADLALLRRRAVSPGYDAAAAAYDDVLGVPACFGPGALGHLHLLAPAHGARRLLRDGTLRVARVLMPGAALDIDTVDDLRRFVAGTEGECEQTPI